MRIKSWMVVVLSMVCLVVSTPSASASPLSLYQVTINTNGLGGGLFGLDFQLSDGSGTDDGNSLVTLSNFNFGGGSASGGPTISGGASGDVITGASLTDNSFFNDFLQYFNAGSTLSFTLGLALDGPEAAPDLFTLAILDASGTGFEIPTLGPLGLEFVSYQYGDSVPQGFGSDPTQTGFIVPAPTITPLGTPVPEPATFVLLGAGLVTALVRGRFKLHGESLKQ